METVNWNCDYRIYRINYDKPANLKNYSPSRNPFNLSSNSWFAPSLFLPYQQGRRRVDKIGCLAYCYRSLKQFEARLVKIDATVIKASPLLAAWFSPEGGDSGGSPQATRGHSTCVQ